MPRRDLSVLTPPVSQGVLRGDHILIVVEKDMTLLVIKTIYIDVSNFYLTFTFIKNLYVIIYFLENIGIIGNGFDDLDSGLFHEQS